MSQIVERFYKDSIKNYDAETGDIFYEDSVLYYKVRSNNKIFEVSGFWYDALKHGREIIKKSDFIIPPYKDFREKILLLYNIDMDSTYDWILNPDIDHSVNIIIHDGYINYSPMSGQAGDEDAESMIMLNKMILNDDSLAFNWMKINDPYGIINQVKELGVTTNPKWLKFAFENTNFRNNDNELHNYIFGQSPKDEKYHIRKNMLDSMIYYGVDMSLLSNVLQRIEYAKENGDSLYADNYDDMIGFLLVKIGEVGQYGFIELRMDNDPRFKQYLQNHNYFNDEYLRSFSEKTYLSPTQRKREGLKSSLSPYSNYYINDKDGYTNMRSTPSAKAEILTTIPNKDQIDVVERDESGWWKVRYKGYTGYVHKSRIIDYLIK